MPQQVQCAVHGQQLQFIRGSMSTAPRGLGRALGRDDYISQVSVACIVRECEHICGRIHSGELTIELLQIRIHAVNHANARAGRHVLMGECCPCCGTNSRARGGSGRFSVRTWVRARADAVRGDHGAAGYSEAGSADCSGTPNCSTAGSFSGALGYCRRL